MPGRMQWHRLSSSVSSAKIEENKKALNMEKDEEFVEIHSCVDGHRYGVCVGVDC